MTFKLSIVHKKKIHVGQCKVEDKWSCFFFVAFICYLMKTDSTSEDDGKKVQKIIIKRKKNLGRLRRA